MFFGKATKRHRHGVVIDIGSSSVGVAIIESKQSDALPRVVYSHRVNMRISKNNTEPAERLRQMREALFSASLTISKDGLSALAAENPKAKISKIFLVCASPWAYTISRDVAYEDDTDFKITPALISDLAKSAEHEIDSELKNTKVNLTGEFEIVERATVDVRINGYSVHNPFNLVGKTLSLSHITGFILKDIISAVYEVRDKIFTDTEIQAHTSMLVSYCVFRDLFPKTANLTLVSVGGESTEVGLTEKGVLIETQSVLYGSNTLVREISDMTKDTPEHILTILRSHAEKKLHDEAHIDVSKLTALYDEKLTELFSGIFVRRGIPRTIIVTADPNIEHFARASVIKNIEKVTSQKFTVLHIEQKTLEHIAENELLDVPLAIESRFFHKLHACGDMEAT